MTTHATNAAERLTQLPNGHLRISAEGIIQTAIDAATAELRHELGVALSAEHPETVTDRELVALANQHVREFAKLAREREELRAENERLQQKMLDIAVRIHGPRANAAIDIARIIQGTNPERGE